MATTKDEPKEGEATNKDHCAWIKNEIELSEKAHELRTKELRSILDVTAANKISASETNDRILKYLDRWGDALPGIWSVRGASDDDIVKRLDGAKANMRSRTHAKRVNRASGIDVSR